MKDRRSFLLARMQLPGESGCMPWSGKRNRGGYGEISVRGTYGGVAHRAAYELFVGPIPAGHQLDHLCRNRACCNPMHLEPVTQAENTRRGMGATAQNARKTFCIAGHPLAGENVYINPAGSRVCRECKRARDRRYHAAGSAS